MKTYSLPLCVPLQNETPSVLTTVVEWSDPAPRHLRAVCAFLSATAVIVWLSWGELGLLLVFLLFRTWLQRLCAVGTELSDPLPEWSAREGEGHLVFWGLLLVCHSESLHQIHGIREAVSLPLF